MKWRKVWKDDPASTFAALCPTTKAIAYYLVCNANESGGIGPWGDDWKANVCKSLGVPTRQRKLWFRCLDELMADGWLCQKNGSVAIKNFVRFQAGRVAPKRSRVAPSCAESSTNGILVEAKPAKSLGLILQEEKRIEEKRIEENRIEKKNKVPPAPVVELFEYWKAKTGMGKRTVLDAERKRYFTAAIKNYGLADCKLAVDGAMLSPFHTGENDRGTRYLKVKHIFAKAENTEEFIGYVDNPPKRPRSKNPDDRHFDEVVANIERKKKKREQWNND